MFTNATNYLMHNPYKLSLVLIIMNLYLIKVYKNKNQHQLHKQ